MIALDEDALVCDLAETYHIYDYRALPLSLAATLAVGLGHNSRIHQRIAGLKAPLDTILLMEAVDLLATILWSRSEDAEKGRNRPEPMSSHFIESAASDAGQFESADDFEAFRAQIFSKEAGD